MSLGQRIRTRRKQIGLSQSELAGHEVTREYISRIESGRAQPSPKVLLYIAQQLNTSVDSILGKTSGDSEIEAHLHTSCEHYANSNYEKALEIAYAAKALVISETCSQTVRYSVQRQLGLCLLSTHQYMAATEVLDEALSLVDIAEHRDKYVEVLYLTANSYCLAQSFSRAAHGYEQVIKYTKNRKKLDIFALYAWIYLGSSYFRNGNLKASRDAYEEALMDTTILNKPTARIDCMMGLGWVYYKTEELKKAITITREAERLSNLSDQYSMTKIKHNLGIMYQDVDLHHRASDILSDCMDEYLSGQDSIGEASLLEDMALRDISMKNFQPAIDKLRRALSVVEDLDTHILRGRIYRGLAIAVKELQHREYEEYVRIALGYFQLVGAQWELKNTIQTFSELRFNHGVYQAK